MNDDQCALSKKRYNWRGSKAYHAHHTKIAITIKCIVRFNDFSNEVTNFFSKTSCSKTYQEKGRLHQVYKQNGNLWRPLLNVDVKWISKVLSNQIKDLIPNLILPNQKVIKRDNWDILGKTDILKIESYLLTIDNEKAFDFVGHYFSHAIIEKYGFKNKFLR